MHFLHKVTQIRRPLSYLRDVFTTTSELATFIHDILFMHRPGLFVSNIIRSNPTHCNLFGTTSCFVWFRSCKAFDYHMLKWSPAIRKIPVPAGARGQPGYQKMFKRRPFFDDRVIIFFHDRINNHNGDDLELFSMQNCQFCVTLHVA